VIVDATAPAAPVITSPAEGEPVSAHFFFVSGTAQANSRVELFEGTTSVGTTTANTSGGWAISLRDVAEGSHTYTAKATDAASNTSAASASRTVIADATAPAAPVITSPTEGKLVTARFQVTGTAEASSRVSLFEGTSLKGTATANSSGIWIVPLTVIANGSHTYTAKARDAAGNFSAASAPRTVIVDATVPAAPVITSPANNSFDTDGNITVSGAAEANSTVTLFEGTTSKGTTQVNSSGAWSKTLGGVTNGSHTYTAKAKDAAGNISAASNARTVIVDKIKPRVTTTNPLAGATGVAPATNVVATFSEAMNANTLRNPDTLRSVTFTLARRNPDGTTTAVAAKVSYDTANKRAILNPDVNLQLGKTYIATVTTGAKDLAGNALDQISLVGGNQSKVWTFTVRT